MLPALLPSLLPDTSEWLLLCAAVLVLNATPGLDFVLTVSRTLQSGVAAGASAALGISAGCLLHLVAAALGLATLLSLYPKAFVAVQSAGAAYLVWLGLGMWLQAWRGQGGKAIAAKASERKTQSNWMHFRAGVMTNLLNPKVGLFMLAFLPQFVPLASPHKSASLLILGGWTVLQGTVFLLLLVTLTAQLRRLRPHPSITRALQTLGGGLFFALAWRLLKERPLNP